MTEHLEERDGVGILDQGGVNVMVLAEGLPDGKGIVGGIPAGTADSQWKGARNSEEVSFEARSVVIGASCHGGVTGKRAFSSLRNTWSSRAKEREQKSAMVLVVPGTDKTCNEQLSARLRWAR
jgi:hypothetical protein